MLGELTGSSEFDKCHSNDMGIYGFDSPRKLIQSTLEYLYE